MMAREHNEKLIIDEVVIPIEDVVIDLRARDWCKMPYPNHPKGCPNYNQRDSCPPQAPIWNDYMSGPYILVGVKFYLRGWVDRMRGKHPKWSDRQCRCCLYWQGKVRKRLREICEGVRDNHLDSNSFISYCPEAMGVHVFETCYKNGIKLYKNPQDFVWKIAIIGDRKL